MTAVHLDVRNVGYTYGARPPRTALAGVSFEVNRGEIFGLLGPNGAGKTTLLSILSGLREASAGNVLLDGEPLHPRRGDLKRRLGLVPQELALYPELTAAENLRFFGELYRLPSADLDARVATILETIGLTERAHERASSFSGGMQRRLNLGIALVHNPAILLLDEPTAGVDPQSRNHLFEGVRSLHRSGKTILYTSHYMEEVEALCDRIGIIDHGKLIACDTLANLLSLLPSRIRFRLLEPPTTWDGLSCDDLVLHLGDPHSIESRNPAAALVRLTSWCADRGLRFATLETETPNLERVFLHLTGNTLRDS
jgi:ABC-2 type transport system ATP-binding protein